MPAQSDRAAAVRRFNRFYTQKIGVLNEGLSRSPFSLSEARVLYEIAQREESSASEIASDLGLDRGYLSRILAAFGKQKLLTRKRSGADGRKALLRLTSKGRKSFAALNAGTQQEITDMLGALGEADQQRLLGAMSTIEELLGGGQAPRLSGQARAPVLHLRTHRPGDLGWIVERHGAIYAQEYGWNEEFEALVAQIVADFLRHHDPERERCWIAEVDGERAGSIVLVRKSQNVGQLRLLLVEPSARGLGIGKRLVGECIAFARKAGYKKMVLWTNDVLHAARQIYISCGFGLVEEEKHHSWGADLVSQVWELKL